jgi:hypothetical protein
VEVFYSSLAGISFTLLGLWWVVMQFRYELFMSKTTMRLTAYAATLYFLAPGVISLFAVLSIEEESLWRYGGLLGGLLGLGASALALRSGELGRAQRVEEIIMLVFFVLILALSFITTPVLGLKPILIVAIVDIGVLVLGVQFAWQFFASAPVKSD